MCVKATDNINSQITTKKTPLGFSFDKAKWLRCNRIENNELLQNLNLNRLYIKYFTSRALLKQATKKKNEYL